MKKLVLLLSCLALLSGCLKVERYRLAAKEVHETGCWMGGEPFKCRDAQAKAAEKACIETLSMERGMPNSRKAQSALEVCMSAKGWIRGGSVVITQ